MLSAAEEENHRPAFLLKRLRPNAMI